MFEIRHLIKINAAPTKVFEAISTAEGIRHWWTDDVALDPKVGGAAEFGFYGHQFVIKGKIGSIFPGKSVEWSDLTSAPGAGFDGTTVTFDVRPEEAHSRLFFVQKGYKEMGDGYAGSTTRWGFYLISLKRYLETGVGSPNPNDADL